MNSSYFHNNNNNNSNNMNSKLLLPPISEIKFSESIKKKLYSKNNNKTGITSISNNTNVNHFKSKSVDQKEIPDDLSKKNLALSENFNGHSTESEEFFSTVNNENSVFIDEDHNADEEEDDEGENENEDEDNDYEEDYDDEDDDDDDDEFIYLVNKFQKNIFYSFKSTNQSTILFESTGIMTTNMIKKRSCLILK